MRGYGRAGGFATAATVIAATPAAPATRTRAAFRRGLAFGDGGGRDAEIVFPRQRAIEHFLDGGERFPVVGRAQRDGAARAAGASRAPDAVDVILGMHGHVEIEDVAHRRECRGRARRRRSPPRA